MNDNDVNGEGNFPLDNPIKQYKGSKDYVYVTYSYKDSKEVFPNLKMIEDRGINISYNEGLSENTCDFNCREDRIGHSNVFIPFLTPNFVESDSCFKDVFSACVLHKTPVIPIYLKETDLDESLYSIIRKEEPILKYAMNDEKVHDIFNEELNLHLKDKDESINRFDKSDKLFGSGNQNDAIYKKATINLEGTSGMFTRLLLHIMRSIGGCKIPKPVYISFAHENIAEIYGDFTLLNNIKVDLIKDGYIMLKDYNIKFEYDRGVDFYNEDDSDSLWFNSVEYLIKDCSLLLFYVSEKSLASKRRILELRYALENDIPVILIFIEQLNQISSSIYKLFEGKLFINKYDLNRKEYENALIRRLEKAMLKQTKADVANILNE